jgi:hypothetical protein
MPKIRCVTWALLVAACGCGTAAHGQQIQSMGSLTFSDGFGSFGDIGDIDGEIDPVTWHLWTFDATQDDEITWAVERTTDALDPIAAVYAVNFSGQLLEPFGTLIFDAFGAAPVSVGDDNAPPATGGGPFGDPAGSFTAPVEGVYSILIGSYESLETGPQNYRVFITGSSFTATDPCNVADISPFFAQLNVNDIIDFVNAFNAMDLLADISPPGGDGVLNTNDIVDFVNAFNLGCP